MLGTKLRSKLIRNLLREKVAAHCEKTGKSLGAHSLSLLLTLQRIL